MIKLSNPHSIRLNLSVCLCLLSISSHFKSRGSSIIKDVYENLYFVTARLYFKNTVGRRHTFLSCPILTNFSRFKLNAFYDFTKSFLMVLVSYKMLIFTPFLLKTEKLPNFIPPYPIKFLIAFVLCQKKTEL